MFFNPFDTGDALKNFVAGIGYDPAWNLITPII